MEPLRQHSQVLIPPLEGLEGRGAQASPGIEDARQVQFSGSGRPSLGHPLAEQGQSGRRAVQLPAGMGQCEALGQ